MRKKIPMDDSVKIAMLFCAVFVVLVLSFSFCFFQNRTNTHKYYENYEIPEITIQNQVITFIEFSNTMTTDRKKTTQSIINTYHLLTDKTASMFSAYAKEHNFFDDFGNITREIYIKGSPKNIDPNTYQIEYKIVTREISGLLQSNKDYKAIVSTKILEPAIRDVKDNPLGIYITDFKIEEINKREEI